MRSLLATLNDWLAPPAKITNTLIRILWPYCLFALMAYGQARLGKPFSAATLVCGCALLLALDRLVIPLFFEWNYAMAKRRTQRERARKTINRLKAWMFPQGIPSSAGSVVLVTPELYTEWKDRFQDIADITASAGEVFVPCRWPRHPKLQERAAGIAANMLRNMQNTRSLVVPESLDVAMHLICGRLYATRHNCNLWRLVPGRSETHLGRSSGHN